MFNKLRKWMKAARADISAVLMIAFLFQFITPVVVLAGDTEGLSEFENAMRASICRVSLSDDPSDTTSHTDKFVCDYCILCTVDATTKDLDVILPEVISHDFYDAHPQTVENQQNVYLADIGYLNIQAPRAPPVK